MHRASAKEPAHSPAKRRRLLPVIGATIVLATFVVKDAWRENLKDLVDSIENAQNVFLIRDDSKAVTSQLRVIEQKIDRIEQVSTLTTKDPFTGIAVNSQMMIFRELQDNIGTDLDNTARLMDKVPGQEANRNTEEELKKGLVSARESFRQSGVTIARLTPTITPDGVFPAEARQAIFDASADLSNKTNDLWTRTHNLSATVLKEAASELQVEERNFTWVKIASYILYVLGWTLTLFGKMFGIEDLAVAD
ncbi:MAG TPA: hypothetical protein VN948_15270 [Terriglobales bacterium]|nr:hypothetical protein [Terriglobales bacterium]